MTPFHFPGFYSYSRICPHIWRFEAISLWWKRMRCVPFWLGLPHPIWSFLLNSTCTTFSLPIHLWIIAFIRAKFSCSNHLPKASCLHTTTLKGWLSQKNLMKRHQHWKISPVLRFPFCLILRSIGFVQWFFSLAIHIFCFWILTKLYLSL